MEKVSINGTEYTVEEFMKMENLSINGDLDLRGCTSLTSLPDNLSVRGNLDLRGCTSLTSLPDNLSVRGNLYLRGCTLLTLLPENLSVEGYLDLNGCFSLRGLNKKHKDKLSEKDLPEIESMIRKNNIIHSLF